MASNAQWKTRYGSAEHSLKAPYKNISASSSAWSLNREPENQSKTKDRAYAAKPSMNSSSRDISIEDVTGDQEMGYDGDVEVLYPDEYDEPSSDDQHSSDETKQLNEDGLAKRLSRLYYEDKSPKSKLRLSVGSRSSVPSKRAHSDSESEADVVTEEVPEGRGVRNLLTSHRRARRRIRVSVASSSPEPEQTVALNKQNERMELDNEGEGDL